MIFEEYSTLQHMPEEKFTPLIKSIKLFFLFNSSEHQQIHNFLKIYIFFSYNILKKRKKKNQQVKGTCLFENKIQQNKHIELK